MRHLTIRLSVCLCNTPNICRGRTAASQEIPQDALTSLFYDADTTCRAVRIHAVRTRWR